MKSGWSCKEKANIIFWMLNKSAKTNSQPSSTNFFWSFKLVSAIFSYYSVIRQPLKIYKKIFVSSQKLSSFSRYLFFVFSSSLLLKNIPYIVMYHMGNFHDLIPTDFWIIWKIVFAALCKAMEHRPMEHRNCEKEGKKNVQKRKKNSQEHIELFRGSKDFVMLDFSKFQKIENTSCKIQYARDRKALILRILKVRRSKLVFELDAVV